MRVQQQIPLAGQELRPQEASPINGNDTDQGLVNSRAVGI